MSSKASIVIIILVVLLAGGFLYRQYFQGGPDLLSVQEAGEKAIVFINENMLPEGTEASLIETGEESGIYKIRLKIGEAEYDSYVTKNGKLLFQAGIDLEKKPERASEQPEQEEIPKTDEPEVLLFVMSYCPYGNQAEEAMRPVVKLLGDKVEVKVHYVIYSDYETGFPDYCLDEESKYCSMHGIVELNQNIREMCIYREQKEKFWDFLMAVNKDCNLENIEECWEGVAEEAGIGVGMVKTCQEEKGLELVKQEKELNEKYDISGSPSLVINGVKYTGARTSEGYKQAICGAFKESPEACGEILESETPSTGGGACQ